MTHQDEPGARKARSATRRIACCAGSAWSARESNLFETRLAEAIPAGWVERLDTSDRTVVNGRHDEEPAYPIVGTNMKRFFGRGRDRPARAGRALLRAGRPVSKLAPAYKDNADGTVSDLNTGSSAEDYGCKEDSLEAAHLVRGRGLCREAAPRRLRRLEVPSIKNSSPCDANGPCVSPRILRRALLRPHYGRPTSTVPFIDSQ